MTTVTPSSQNMQPMSSKWKKDLHQRQTKIHQRPMEHPTHPYLCTNTSNTHKQPRPRRHPKFTNQARSSGIFPCLHVYPNSINFPPRHHKRTLQLMARTHKLPLPQTPDKIHSHQHETPTNAAAKLKVHRNISHSTKKMIWTSARHKRKTTP